MNRLPDQQPTAPTAGQPTPTDADRDRIRRLFAALDEVAAEKPTAVRIEDPDVPSWKDGPRIGTTPPVPQPGIPAMSQWATDAGRLIMYSSLATVPPGLIGIGAMVASEHANPTVIGMICGCIVAAPFALAVPFIALKSLMKSAKEVVQAAPPDIHQHYSGEVHQDNRQNHLHTDTRGLIATTRNELPPAR